MENKFAYYYRLGIKDDEILEETWRLLMEGSPEQFCADLAAERKPSYPALKIANRSFPYYEDAKKSEVEARLKLFETFPNNQPTKKGGYDPIREREQLLALIRAGLPLRVFEDDFQQMLVNDDETFFIRLGEVLKKERAQFRKLQINDLSLHLVSLWTEHLLWLMTDSAAFLYFERGLGLRITEAAYTKARQRLKLIQHKKPQPISGFSPSSGFIFRSGDLDTYLEFLSR